MKEKKNTKLIVYPWTVIKNPWKNERTYSRSHVVWPELEKQNFYKMSEPDDDYLLRANNHLMELVDKMEERTLMIISNDAEFIKNISIIFPATYALTHLKSIISLDGIRLDSILSYTSKRPFIEPDNRLLLNSQMVYIRDILSLPDRRNQRKWDVGIFYGMLSSIPHRNRLFIGTHVVSEWNNKSIKIIERAILNIFGQVFVDMLFHNVRYELFMRSEKAKSNKIRKFN